MSTSTAETPDGARLAFRRRTGPGPPVVLSHPHTGRMESFDPLLSVWSGDALIWDRRGYGGSTRGGDETVRQEQDLLCLLDHQRIGRAILVGVAAGGAASLALGAMEPGRVLALGIVGSFMGQSQQFWLRATGETRPEGDAAALELSPDFRRRPDARRWAEIVAANAASGAGEPPQPAAADLSGLKAVGRLALATGRQDRLFTPAMLAHAASLAPQAEVEVLQGVAHAPHVEDPQGFAAWLDRLVNRV